MMTSVSDGSARYLLPRRAMIAALLVGALLQPWTHPARGDAEYERASLDGLRGICVAGVEVDNEVSSYALSTDLKTQIELRLRAAGIRVYSQSDLDATARRPQFWVQILAIPAGESRDLFAMNVSMDLTQIAWVGAPGTPQKAVLATTWSTSRLLVYGSTTLREGGLKNVVGTMLDEFVNGWMASHATTQGNKP